MGRRGTFFAFAVALLAALVASMTTSAAGEASAAAADATDRATDKALVAALESQTFEIPTLEVVVGAKPDAFPAGTVLKADFIGFISKNYAPPVARTAAVDRDRKRMGIAEVVVEGGKDTVVRMKLIDEANDALQRGRKVTGSLVLTATLPGRQTRAKKRSVSISPVRGPACFGAASRDPDRQCRNAELDTQVIPSPAEALLLPNAFCDLVTERSPNTCSFGLSPFTKSAPRIALIGDSHATHWRGTVEVVAQREGWRAYSLTRSSCPMSRAVRKNDDKTAQRQCTQWNKDVLKWFHRHPEVVTVFVSQQSNAEVVPPRGKSARTYQRWGYKQAWRNLPDSVKHVIVIRDPPSVPTATQDCVERVRRQKGNAGERCKVRRSHRLRKDPAVEAAKEMGGNFVQVADLSRYFCDRTYCFPVIGGALVHKDGHHLTEVYATTLGPILAKHVDKLQKSW